jgi:hypothetical protein
LSLGLITLKVSVQTLHLTRKCSDPYKYFNELLPQSGQDRYRFFASLISEVVVQQFNILPESFSDQADGMRIIIFPEWLMAALVRIR